jgi:hypothetical protein
MWLARCTRPDFGYALSLCSRFVTRWCVASDEMLEHMMGYLESTRTFSLVSWIVPGDSLHSITYCDADHGGCPLTSRSTTGKCLFVVGEKGSLAATRWSAARQGCAAVSTVEAEVVGLNEATRLFALPTTELLTELGQASGAHEVRTDAEAARAAVVKGASKALGHLRKVHRVSLAALHDIFEAHDDLTLVHVPGTSNVADLFTKALPGPRFQLLRGWMGVLPPGVLEVPRDHPARVRVAPAGARS